MDNRYKCDSIYSQCKSLSATSNSAWNKLRDMISSIQDIADKHGIILYNTDLSSCMNGTWNSSGSANGTKQAFEISRDQLRDTALNIISKLPLKDVE